MSENSSLMELTMDQIQTAFDKTLKTFNEPGVRLVLITNKYVDTALKFARENFMTREPVSKSIGIKWTAEYEQLWKRSLDLNLSLMFLSEKDEEPIALRTIRIARYDDTNDSDGIKDQPLKEVVRLLGYCDQKANFFGHFHTLEAFHFLGLAVAPKYQRRGYATKIFNTAVEMIRNFGIDPVYIKVEGSSNFSKKIFEKTGMESLYELFFDDWEVEGRTLIQNTGIHRSVKMYGMKLSTG
ncbi:uncharacterized protein LOC132749460 [Ruditapes philippinarum]|uniref:uncharacterized protein LOC132749460 n=1 Tax=Ruditapes philippinarum TaxID=129788 RepID=UPI00295B806C|nr:uncharacterized protein LOC132749460 [Ruditapes philippinarum]